jgi:hypothetical protein
VLLVRFIRNCLLKLEIVYLVPRHCSSIFGYGIVGILFGKHLVLGLYCSSELLELGFLRLYMCGYGVKLIVFFTFHYASRV